jgi:hypothetical protein
MREVAHTSRVAFSRATSRDDDAPDYRCNKCPCAGMGASGYSITACSGPAACLRSAALVEPIMIASGIEAMMKIMIS